MPLFSKNIWRIKNNDLHLHRGLQNACNNETKNNKSNSKGTENVPAGIYIWNGCAWTKDGSDDEQILFTILTNDGEYRIPTGGALNGGLRHFDWLVSVDGVPVDNCTDCTGHPPVT